MQNLEEKSTPTASSDAFPGDCGKESLSGRASRKAQKSSLDGESSADPHAAKLNRMGP